MDYYWIQQHENAKLYNEKKTKEDDKILDKMLKLEPDEFVAQSKKNEYISEKLTIEMQNNSKVSDKILDPENKIIYQMLKKMDKRVKYRPNLRFLVECLLNIKGINNWAFITELIEIREYQDYLFNGGLLTFREFRKCYPDGNYEINYKIIPDLDEEEEEYDESE